MSAVFAHNHQCCGLSCLQETSPNRPLVCLFFFVVRSLQNSSVVWLLFLKLLEVLDRKTEGVT